MVTIVIKILGLFQITIYCALAVTEVPAESSEVKEAKFIPIIRSVTVLKDVTVITWYTEDRSNIPVDTVYIEWSNDFDNRSSTVSRQGKNQ